MASRANYYGGRLGVLLALEGITQAQVAERLGVSQGAVSKVIHGVSPLSEDLAVRLAAEFTVPLSFFARAAGIRRCCGDVPQEGVDEGL